MKAYHFIHKAHITALTVLILISCLGLQAQVIKWNPNQFRKVDMAERSDTAFVFVSNRPISANGMTEVPELTDTSQRHILYISKEDSGWMVQEMQSLKEAMALLPHRDWVIYTEGMGKTFSGNMKRAYLMQKQYPVNVLLFDYASINHDLGLMKNFRFSLNNAKNSYRQYFQMLDSIRYFKMKTELFKEEKITLFFHSMGNLVFREMMLHKLTVSWKEVFVDHVVLNAACVPQKNHIQWIQDVHFAQRIYVHYNRQDEKLGGATLLSGNRKLGRRFRPPYSKVIRYIDFNSAVGSTHNYFLDLPERKYRQSKIIHHYFEEILQGREVQLSDPDYFSGRGRFAGARINKDG
ncbi:MAG: alpha/beta hydrolase [Chitinophagaceae bacterium]|nr:alpha/beta hydrolase [Chitinophagaceae bacterium]